MTEEEWNSSILVSYESYKETFMSGKYEGVVQRKTEYLYDMQERVENAQNQINSLIYAAIIAAVVIYIVISCIMLALERADNKLRLRDGVERKSLYGGKVAAEIFSLTAISLVTFYVLNNASVASGFASETIKIVLLCAGSVWASLIVTLPVAWGTTAPAKRSRNDR